MLDRRPSMTEMGHSVTHPLAGTDRSKSDLKNRSGDPLDPAPGYLKAVWPEFVGSVFGVWAAPGGFKTIQKCRGPRPPHFWMFLKPPGAVQTGSQVRASSMPTY